MIGETVVMSTLAGIFNLPGLEQMREEAEKRMREGMGPACQLAALDAAAAHLEDPNMARTVMNGNACRKRETHAKIRNGR